ncbi:MAG: hypothetical protein CBC04_00145 [Verrucomicrobia bacterium TMED44]|nr:MAG: hypothetical protein CBC04_00145 [Verrucomicrobia bacterium TMED44]|tara:strand:+ start:1082 stop:1549 length:468 start_codon:yes stop_codon:yes gene_type:complete
MDPITAITAATAAFNVIKKGFDMGKDIEGMYSDMGRWMGAISDVNHANKMAANPPIFKKLFAGSSIEEDAMNAFAAKKKAEQMEDELRTYVNLVYGPNSWNEILKLQVKIRKDRQEQIYAQQELRSYILNVIAIIVASIVGVCGIVGLIWLLMLA